MGSTKSYYKLEKDNGLAFGTIRHWHSSYKSFGERVAHQKSTFMAIFIIGVLVAFIPVCKTDPDASYVQREPGWFHEIMNLLILCSNHIK